MNPNDPKHPWARLTSAARSFSAARDERDTAAPSGFATRFVALAFEKEFSAASLFERFALRAVGVAGLLAVLSVIMNYSVLTAPVAPAAVAEEEELADSPVAMLLKVD